MNLAGPPWLKRRKNSKLIHFYKILNEDTPNYLSEILSNYNQHETGYTLRNTNLRHPAPRTVSFQNSYFITATDLWNNLDDDIKNNCTSLYSFKRALNKQVKPSPPHFMKGIRKYNIIMCQLRNNKSSLNADLLNDHLQDNGLCTDCGVAETVQHYLLECSKYDEQRMQLINNLQGNKSIYEIISISVNDLLAGNLNLSNVQNSLLQDAVIEYIKNTKRFD